MPSAYQFKEPAPAPKSTYAGQNTLHVPGSTNVAHITPHHHLTDTNAARPPPEILNFIEKQEGYIEQLERESQFCRVSFLHY